MQQPQAHNVTTVSGPPLRLLTVVAFLMAACLGGLLFIHLWRGQDKAEDDARIIVTALGQAIEQHVTGQLRGVAALLDEAGVVAQTGLGNSPSVAAHLRERLTAFPEIHGLVLLTADGRQNVLQGEADLSPALVAWLLPRLEAGGTGLVIGPPDRGEDQGQRRFVVAKVIAYDGAKAAVATLFEADALAGYLETLRVAETEVLAVVHGADQVVAAAPDHAQAFGRPVRAGSDDVVAVLPLENLDLKVWVGADRDTAFQLWRTNAALESLLYMLFCAALYFWARRSDEGWCRLVAVRDGLEDAVARRGVELQQARNVVEQRARQISAANRELQRLSMVAAHHLQEPLRPLVSYSQMLGRVLPSERLPGLEVLSHLVQGGKDMKTLLKGFQLRVAQLSIDAPAETAELHQVMQRAMVDAGTSVAIRPEPLPMVSVPPRAAGELLVQVFRTLDGLGAQAITVAADQQHEIRRLVIRAIGPLAPGAESSVAVRVCLSLAGLNDLPLSFTGDAFVLDLPAPDLSAAEMAAPSVPMPRPRREWRARLQALGLIAALACAVLWQVERERDLAIHAAQVLTRTVANSIDQQIAGSLRGIDTILAEAEQAIERGAHRNLAFSIRMEAILRAFPEINHVGLADSMGRMEDILWPPRQLPDGLINVADRAYFQRAKSATLRGMAIGDPVRGRVGDERSWHVARPLHDGDGAFAGVVFANINPDHYARFLERVLLDPDGGTALIGTNGLMIARAPLHAQKFGINIASSDLFTRWLPAAPIDVAPLISKADGNDKYVAYRLLAPYPLVVTSAVSRGKALDKWRDGLASTLVVATMVSALLFALAWRADRDLRRIRRQHLRLEAEVQSRTHGLEQARALSDVRAASLERLNVQLRELMGVITEELEAPLAGLQRDVAALTELLAAAADGTGRDELAYVAAAIGRLAVLLRDFQRFVTVVSTSPRPEPVDLPALVAQVAEEMEYRFGAGVLAATAEGASDMVADPSMLRELLAQLFSNAILYRGRESAAGVHVRAVRRPRDWLVQICDDGPGLSPEQLSHDPQAFESGVGQSADSTGIGLAICRVIAQAHGGDLWLTNQDGGGAMVSVVVSAESL